MLTSMVLISLARDPSTSASQNTGITGVRHSTWPKNVFLNYPNKVYILLLVDVSLGFETKSVSIPHQPLTLSFKRKSIC